ncbi:hypothetical protein ABB02_01246 [Clostridiaceae bacterium JG1575]|nr:hypothetical protein ABB02_01246 [Clostridiaceae bacterium JG1575]
MPKKSSQRHRTGLLGLLLMALMVLSGCFNIGNITEMDQTLPKSPDLGLYPEWTFQQAHPLTEGAKIPEPGIYKGMQVLLSKSLVRLGNEMVEDPDIKAMQVQGYEYFLTRYKVSPKDVGLRDGLMDVLSISDAKGFSARVFVVDEAHIAVERNNILFHFQRSPMDGSVTGKGQPKIPAPAQNKKKDQANGVLIGLRGSRTITDLAMGPAAYRTLWIQVNEQGAIQVYEVADLLFPRDIFYRMKVHRQENAQVIWETLSIENLTDHTEIRESLPTEDTSRYTNITFLSNDYFSAEQRWAPTKYPGPFQYYSTRTIKKPDYENRVSLTDLFGSEGTQALETAVRAAISTAKVPEGIDLRQPDEKAFLLKRYSGRWIYEARINDSERFSKDFFSFRVNLPDNQRVYRYDNLAPKWPQIRSAFPKTKDAVASLNGKFTILRTDNALQIFRRDAKGALLAKPEIEIPLHSEEIIMHEWARGSYVEEWAKVVKGLGKRIK